MEDFYHLRKRFDARIADLDWLKSTNWEEIKANPELLTKKQIQTACGRLPLGGRGQATESLLMTCLDGLATSVFVLTSV